MAPWSCQTFARERDKTQEHAEENPAKLVVLAASKFRSHCDPSAHFGDFGRAAIHWP